MHVRKFREIKIVLGAIENALATGFILFTVNSFVKVSLAPFTRRFAVSLKRFGKNPMPNTIEDTTLIDLYI